jgi:UDP-N-acetylmuramoyl-tripeptide--D-alanyl-D-alanine ligase
MIGVTRIGDVAAFIEADYRGTNVPFQGVSTDTRTLQPGDLYVALAGERFDGHDFIEQAMEKGASAVLVSRAPAQHIPYLLVDDTTKALGKLALYNRRHFKNPVIAVTGSSGKTTVKEMISNILRQQGEVLFTRGNLNNHIGAPLTLLRLNQQDAAVIELGASGLGEIRYTGELACPDVGVITNAASAHLEGFGSLEGVVRTKGEMIDVVNETGSVILNADSPYFAEWRARAGQKKVLAFGVSEAADVRAVNLQVDDSGRYRFLLQTPKGEADVYLPVMGQHNVGNACAAAAACIAAGVELALVVSGLESFSGVSGRLVEKTGCNGAVIIDDTYNANPASLRAAIDVLVSRPGMRVLVLGDMAELGAESHRAHAEIGVYANSKGVDMLLAKGAYSRSAVDAFDNGGHWFATDDSLIKFLQSQLKPGVTALVKGSRSARMELVVQAVTHIEKQD